MFYKLIHGMELICRYFVRELQGTRMYLATIVTSSGHLMGFVAVILLGHFYACCCCILYLNNQWNYNCCNIFNLFNLEFIVAGFISVLL